MTKYQWLPLAKGEENLCLKGGIDKKKTQNLETGKYMIVCPFNVLVDPFVTGLSNKDFLTPRGMYLWL